MASKVLVADDEFYIQNILAMKLGQAGYDVVVAQDGQEALERAIEDRPDLVISDYHMPRLNGIELCHRLEENPRTAGIPAILLTSRDFEITAVDLTGTSIRLLEGKPFSPRRIVAAVAELLLAARRPDVFENAILCQILYL